MEKLIELLGGYEPPGGTAGKYLMHASTASNLLASPTSAQFSINPCARAGVVQDYYCPLDFWFSAKHSPNRGLDCSVLSSPIFLEVDVQAKSKIWNDVGSGVSGGALTNLRAICYLTEFDPEVEKQYRSISYAPGGAPLTQIGYQEEHVVVASGIVSKNSAAVTTEIKLNQFSGNVYKLRVYAVNATANSGLVPLAHKPLRIDEIQLKATGTNLVNYDNLSSKEQILNSYHDGGFFKAKRARAAVGNQLALTDICRIDGSKFYELNFKKPYDMSKVSASGSVSMGQLSVPSLRVVISDTNIEGYGMEFNTDTVMADDALVDIHVVAYSTVLISYQTNTSGSTNIRMIQN